MFERSDVTDSHCAGVSFEISDINALARAIALILVQEFSLATQLASNSTVVAQEVFLELSEIESIISLRLKPENRYHRDGFLFQLIMWLSSHLDLSPGDLVSLPHVQAAAKGQDSLIIHRASGNVIALSICEDKATENPRKTIRDEVWGEIQKYEKGERDDELRSGVISILGGGGIGTAEAESLIRGISWKGRRRHRVRVTIEGARTTGLFKGFATVITGPHEMRRGETMILPEMRTWMDDFASRVEGNLRTFIRVPDNV